MPKIRRVLISLSDKTGIVEFACELNKLGVEILSTGGTAKVLRDNKIPVIDVSEYTGSPEILEGRLKTLHPKIHGGLLGIRANKEHVREMKENNIEPIDMVIVNLYPFEATIAKEGCTFETAIENIDIGGPTMLRAAAKNWQDVAVVVDPKDYAGIMAELKKGAGEISSETCFRLAQKVFATTAGYDAAICNYINSFTHPLPHPPPSRGREGERGQLRFPSTLAMTYEKVQELRYGENPHQKAAFYKCPHLPKDVPCITNGRQLHGKELSYNNIMDADAALELVKEFIGQTAAVIIKHTNPCGAAVASKLSEAFVAARDCDPTSSFGGIVALTKKCDADTAKAIGDTFFEVIIAPGFESAALDILKAKKNLRLLEIPPLVVAFAPTTNDRQPTTLRKVVGGILASDYDSAMEDVRTCKVVTKRKPTAEELNGLDFAWRISKHVKSNAIVLTSNDRILGVGAGQTSRVDSVKIAIMKMNALTIAPSNYRTIALASDAFFPFRDGVDLAAKAGVTAIVEPGGSIKDQEVIQAADEHNIAMIFTGNRHFRH